MFVVTATTPAPKNRPTRSSAMRKSTGKVRPPKRVRWDSSEQSPLICSRATASESTNMRRTPTVKTQTRTRTYWAPEFIVVIMSDAPTLARASTIPGPMSLSRPAKVDGAEVAPSVVWAGGADDMVELRMLAGLVIGRDGRHQVCLASSHAEIRVSSSEPNSHPRDVPSKRLGSHKALRDRSRIRPEASFTTFTIQVWLQVGAPDMKEHLRDVLPTTSPCPIAATQEWLRHHGACARDNRSHLGVHPVRLSIHFHSLGSAGRNLQHPRSCSDLKKHRHKQGHDRLRPRCLNPCHSACAGFEHCDGCINRVAR